MSHLHFHIILCPMDCLPLFHGTVEVHSLFHRFLSILSLVKVYISHNHKFWILYTNVCLKQLHLKETVSASLQHHSILEKLFQQWRTAYLYLGIPSLGLSRIVFYFHYLCLLPGWGVTTTWWPKSTNTDCVYVYMYTLTNCLPDWEISTDSEWMTTKKLRVKLTGDGTNIGKRLQVVAFAFTILEEGQKAYGASGNHCIAIFNRMNQWSCAYNTLFQIWSGLILYLWLVA